MQNTLPIRAPRQILKNRVARYARTAILLEHAKGVTDFATSLRKEISGGYLCILSLRAYGIRCFAPNSCQCLFCFAHSGCC